MREPMSWLAKFGIRPAANEARTNHVTCNEFFDTLTHNLFIYLLNLETAGQTSN